MISVLLSAYAVSPSWGSEQGVGWHMAVSLARYCKVHVITEGEWRGEIESALESLPQKDNLRFYYLPVSDRIHRMCWRQGDYRFYLHYRHWQKRALRLSREIMASEHIDVLHQLNMVGFREPGYLWKIKDVPLVWGPFGGMELMPLKFLWHGDKTVWMGALLKNVGNMLQRSCHPRVIKAFRRADVLVAATEGCAAYVRKRYGLSVDVISETGCDAGVGMIRHDFSAEVLELLWVGKFSSRKQLGLALETVSRLKGRVRLHVLGAGSQSEEMSYHAMASKLGDSVVWHGKVSNAEVQEMMKSSHLLLFTSIMEATSTVVLEAIGNCLPVVCFDTCGFGSVVDETVGVKIPLRSYQDAVQDFSSEIAALCSDRPRLARLSEGCARKQPSLSWDWKARRYLSYYEEVCSR